MSGSSSSGGGGSGPLSILSPIMKRKGRRPSLLLLLLLLAPMAAAAAIASSSSSFAAGRRVASASTTTLALIGSRGRGSSGSGQTPGSSSLRLPISGKRKQQRGGLASSAVRPATAAAAAGSAGGVGVVGLVGQLVEEVAQGLALFSQVLSAKKDHLVAGAVARGVMISSLYPVDTVKTRVQMFGAAEGLKKLNLRALYAGMASSLLGQMPYGMLVYGSYEVYKDMLVDGLPRLGKDATSLLAAVMSDVTGSVWLCPSEVIKQQMQSAAVGAKASLSAAVKQCWREGKGIGGFYQGYGGLLLRDIPFRALQLPLYERTKAWLDRRMQPDSPLANALPGNDLDAWKEGFAGAFSGTLAAWVTTPFDVLKTRLQVDASYKGPWDCAVRVFRKEGIKGLFSGAVPRTLYIGPSTALFFVAYGAVRSYIHASPSLAESWEHPEQFEEPATTTTPPISSISPLSFNKRPSRGERANFLTAAFARLKNDKKNKKKSGAELSSSQPGKAGVKTTTKKGVAGVRQAAAAAVVGLGRPLRRRREQQQKEEEREE